MSGFSIIFQNDDIVIVDKHCGVDFHDSDGELGLFHQVKKSLGVSEFYPVHRLDKVTSGLVILAKTAQANAELCRLFAERDIEKYYLAIASGKPKKKQGLITGDMERSRRSAWRLLKSKDNPAVTQFFSYSAMPGLRLYLLRPRTGKTHQLRVALKSIGVPILGDKIYSGADSYTIEGQQVSADRAYLHAYALRFCLFGENYEFTCPPTEGQAYVNTASQLQDIARPWELSWPSV